ncbi:MULTISPECIES: hypothetical protein [unclassified Streptomyces]|uniref:hypothetical protein n=1 Tax=unclassified Streptomyces TaxID=2593676 RepID=UPI000DB972C9|nr:MULTISPECIES: hypothetical protein [unclassified Streptomyces]MYT68613.1 hypothetical protein [Streptomyces sp. SID8367]RAJ86285.1 hypothetical protein K377_03132 [Streptomyces sp. PsTaAH-137]
MPDRSLRHTLPAGAVLLREGRPTSPSKPSEPSGPSGGPSSEESPSKETAAPKADNPFAPPPEDAPDRPWQPRRPEGSDAPEGGGGGHSPWGSQWSDRQPGRSQGGRFGDRPRPGGGQGGPEGQGPGPGGGMRWDPTDPAQRRARYALLSGMWGFFFALFNWPYVALLLGALALYWGISSLRAKPRNPDPDKPAPAVPDSTRPQTTAAVSGLVTGGLALALVASLFTVRMVYSDFYECRSDALTNQAQKSCDDILPKQLRPLLGSD